MAASEMQSSTGLKANTPNVEFQQLIASDCFYLMKPNYSHLVP